MWEYFILFLKFVMWIFVIGMSMMGAWTIWVYAMKLPSHSEQTEEEEKRLIASLHAGKGLRASEMGENCD